MNRTLTGLLIVAALAAGVIPSSAQKNENHFDYLLLATSKTSTMEVEMNDAAKEGYRFSKTMAGETSFSGAEVVVIMEREKGTKPKGEVEYKLLATKKTKTMQKELSQAGNEGFRYCGQSVAETSFGGKETLVILQRDREKRSTPYQYRLLATKKTKTMQQELTEAGNAGFELLGMSVAPTAFAGSEVVCILSKKSD